MELPFLRDFPDIVDNRPIEIGDDFQSKPFQYTINSNMRKYTGMDADDIELIKKHLEKTAKE